MNLIYAVSHQLIKAFAAVWFRIEARGAENVPASGPVILASNHASHLDPVLVAVRLRRQCHFLAKSELFDVPVLGRFLKLVNCHPIRRGAVDRAALRKCAELMERGEMLIVFPEGTRSRDGSLQPGRSGVAMIAAHAGAPVVPVYLNGTFHAMPPGAGFPRPRKIRVFYGTPFRLDEDLSGVTPRERHEAMSRKLMTKIADLKGQATGSPAANRTP